MSQAAEIHLEDSLAQAKRHFLTGETVSGTVVVSLQQFLSSLSKVKVALVSTGDVEWVEYSTTGTFVSDQKCHNRQEFWRKELNFEVQELIVASVNAEKQRISIPFDFVLPKDQNLPSSMTSKHGWIKYEIKVDLLSSDSEIIHSLIREIVVLAPMEENLLFTVGGSVEKSVLLHGGNVHLNASLERKGFAPGESIKVHVSIENQSNTFVIPRVTLFQLQIGMCSWRHKIVELPLNTPSEVEGALVEPHSFSDQFITVGIPTDEALSIKTDLITVKYYVRVLVDIPHAFDLHLSLPLVVTTDSVIHKLQEIAPKQFSSE